MDNRKQFRPFNECEEELSTILEEFGLLKKGEEICYRGKENTDHIITDTLKITPRQNHFPNAMILLQYADQRRSIPSALFYIPSSAEPTEPYYRTFRNELDFIKEKFIGDFDREIWRAFEQGDPGTFDPKVDLSLIKL
ncbi:MAG: hypothetical protein ABIH34_04040 [Nanoarchaeota archaeon]